jgi:multicomponent K+:H+ antiporter subunit A
MSVVALGGGIVVYSVLRPYLYSDAKAPRIFQELNGQRIFDGMLLTISWRLPRAVEGYLGTRRLQPQLLLLISVAIVSALVPLYTGGLNLGAPPGGEVDLVFALLWVVGMACALGAAYLAKFHRLAALILLGGAGLVTSLSFVWLSAPDLALTQLLVETVTTVLLLLGLRWLPKRIQRPSRSSFWAGLVRWYRIRDFFVAAAAGTGVAALAYAAMVRTPGNSISQFFIENAYSKGGGTNIVNVILVDFRGFDTLGEITVLCVVALTVYGLLRRFRPAADSIPVPEQQQIKSGDEGDTARDTMAVPAFIMALLFPITGITAVFLLLRGHDSPGGGFVAGITMAIAVILQYLARGTHWVETRLRIHPVRWMGVGLVLAGGTGAIAWFFGRPFLTSSFFYAELPLIGRLPIASALFFDLGVFFLVVGATVLMLIALAHQSVRSHRIPQGREQSNKAMHRAEVVD